MQLPRGVSYINANTSEPGLNMLCSPPTPMNNYTLQCEVGNPLRANSRITARVFVQPSSEGLEEAVSEFSFSVRAKSSNPEESGNDSDNVQTFTVPIRVETDFRVTGKSEPAEMEYNISAPLPDKYVYEDELGETVNHIYDVKNRGPSSISEAVVHIFWPSFNDNGEHLLYLLGFDYDRKKAVCEQIKNLNPLAVKTQGSRDYGTWAAHIGQVDAEGFMRAEGSDVRQYGSSYQSSYSSNGNSYSSSSYYQSSGSQSGAGEGAGGRGSVVYEEEEDSYLPPPPALTTHRPLARPPPPRRGPVVADGAEETRLFDTQGQLYAGAGAGQAASSSSSSSSSMSSESGSSGSAGSSGVIYSGWRMLENGTYIRVYDRQQEETLQQSGGAAGAGEAGGAGGAGGAQISQDSYSSSRSSQTGSVYSGSGSVGGSSISSEMSGSSYGNSVSTQLSSSSGSSEGGRSNNLEVGAGGAGGAGQENSIQGSSGGDTGSSNTGWVRQPDGTYVRKSSSWSSWSSSTGGRQGGGGYNSRGQQGGGGGQQVGGSYSSSGQQSRGGYSSTGQQFGGGGQHVGGGGQQVGGSYSSSGQQSRGGYSSTGQQGRGGYSEGDTNLDAEAPQGNIQSGNIHSSSYFESGGRGQDRTRVEESGVRGGQSSRVQGESFQVGGGGLALGGIMGAAVGPGDYHGTMSQAELEREAGGRIFNAGAGTETRNQVHELTHWTAVH